MEIRSLRSKWRPVLCLTITAMAAAGNAAGAADLDWAIATGWSLGGDVDRLAKQGYRIEAVAAGAPQALILASKPWRGNRSPVAEYRLVDRSTVSEAAALGRDGYRLRAFGVDHQGDGLAVFERLVDQPTAPVEIEPMVGNLEEMGSRVAELAQRGFRAVAASGRKGNKPDWLIWQQATTGPREARVVDVDSVAALGNALTTAASEGFAADAVWSRSTKRLSLTGADRLAAVLSRPHGSSRPVAAGRVRAGDEPSSGNAGVVRAVVPWRNEAVFVQAGQSSPHTWTRRNSWTEPGSETFAPYHVEQQLESFQHEPVGFAWVVWSSGKPSALITRDREAEAESGPKRAQGTAPALTIPADATTLDATSAPWRAWIDLLATIRRVDVAGSKARWTGATAEAWTKRVKTFKAPLGMGFSEKELLEGLADDLPADPVLLGGWQRGEQATLRVEATGAGGRSWSDLTMAFEEGRWKLADQSRWEALD